MTEGLIVAALLFLCIAPPMLAVVWLWERRAEREDRRLLVAHRSWFSRDTRGRR